MIGFSSRCQPFGRMSLVFVILLSSFFWLRLDSQVLKGKITDKAGQPVQYATVYVQEIKHGTTSNSRGDYEIRLPEGNYQILFQSLGYEPYILNILFNDSTIIRNVVLSEQLYQIPEVKIMPSGEDPAYMIMRKAIGFAPYYLNQVSYYKANVYLKGNLLINRIPKLIQRSMRMNRSDDNVSVSAGGKPEQGSEILKEGDSFLMESFNEIEFTAPDKYFQRVISFNSTFPEQGGEISPMEYIRASFYQPVLAEVAISPLSPQAFSHYNFTYLGASLQGNYVIDKIGVFPKRKSQQLFSGTIYIIEDLWCLHSVDLLNENLAGKIRIKELYIPVQEEIWMPVSHQFDIELSILGIRADAGYGSSVKYLKVTPNTLLEKPSELALASRPAQGGIDTSGSKTVRQIEKILRKEEMTNRDMIRLANLMEKKTEETSADSSVKNLEIKENITRVIEKDAGKKDSVYWADIRPIPLSETDLRSLRISDSIKAVSLQSARSPDDSLTFQNKGKGKFRRTIDYLISGHTWSDTADITFTFGGLIEPENLSFNSVDGFIYGMDFRISKNFKNKTSISIYPDIRYAFARDKIMWRLNMNYATWGLNPGRFYIYSGMTSSDINSAGGVNPFLNSVSSLFFKRNFLKLYDRRYLMPGFGKEIANGLEIEFSSGFEERRILQNNTDFSIFRHTREFTDNIPENKYLTFDTTAFKLFTDQMHFEFVTDIRFTPYRRYRIQNGNKLPAGSDWPELRFTWKHGLNRISYLSDRYRHFDMIRLEVSQRKEFSALSEFRWRIRAGAVVTGKQDLPFFDYFHFNTQPINILVDDYDDAFMLPEYYSRSTPEPFFEAHLKYISPYILLKFLPGLSNTLMRENLTLSYLGSRFESHYTEIGYSLSEIFFIGELGIYAGFNDLKYSSTGFKLILRIN